MQAESFPWPRKSDCVQRNEKQSQKQQPNGLYANHWQKRSQPNFAQRQS